MGMNFQSPVNWGRIATIVLGVIIIIIGIYSHFGSAWMTASVQVPFAKGRIVPYELCESEYFSHKISQIYKVKCPRIAMERYFVAIIIICVLASPLAFVGAFKIEMEKFKNIDAGFNILAALLLSTSSVVYIVSAEQIDKLAEKIINPKGETEMLWDLKIATGALALLNSVVYLLTGALILRQSTDEYILNV